MSRLADSLRTIPPTTLGIVLLCCSIHVVLIMGLQLPISRLTFCPHLVLIEQQYYRVLTGAIFHGSLVHLGVNMVSTVALGSLLESNMGTMFLLVSTLWSITLTAVVYICLALTLSVAWGMNDLMNQHSVGFSGVLFHWSVLEANLGGRASQRPRRVFGLVTVPSYLYPWVLLVLLEILMPGLSFTGHLSGILVGTMQLYRLLDILLPSDHSLQAMDQWAICAMLARYPTFVPTPTSSSNSGHENAANASMLLYRDRPSWRNACSHGLHFIKRWLGYIYGAVKVMIFGRGQVANSNIRLWQTHSPLEFDVSDEIDDDDWMGLPPPPSSSPSASTSTTGSSSQKVQQKSQQQQPLISEIL